MEIRKFNAPELKEFIESDEFRNLKVIPITKHRALSYIHNPRLDPQDHILYVAFDDKELVGYRVVMPDKIFLDQNEYKIGWYSCVWVDPQRRGKGIAKQLVEASLKDWNHKIVLGDPVKESKSLYLQTGEFIDFIKPVGLRGYLKFNIAELLVRKYPELIILRPFFRLLDILLNFPNTIRIRLWKLFFQEENIEMEYISEIDSETESFIRKNNVTDLSRRNKAELDWISHYPWVIMSPIKDSQMMKYYFSSQARQFFNLNLKIFENGKLTAFLLFSIRDGHLKIPFISLSEKKDLKKIVSVIYQHLLKYNLTTFSTFNPEIAEFIRVNKNPFIFTKRIQRQFLFSRLFEEYLLKNKVYIQDGEGDTAFV